MKFLRGYEHNKSNNTTKINTMMSEQRSLHTLLYTVLTGKRKKWFQTIYLIFSELMDGNLFQSVRCFYVISEMHRNVWNQRKFFCISPTNSLYLPYLICGRQHRNLYQSISTHLVANSNCSLLLVVFYNPKRFKWIFPGKGPAKLSN